MVNYSSTVEAYVKATEYGIDLKHVTPGDGKCITAEDVDRFIANIEVEKDDD